MNRIRNRALTAVAAALVGASAALPVRIHADDTEIYVGSRTFSEGVIPNVMLILDTSGSMADTDGQTLDRLDRVKVALNGILDQTTNVNLGLMRFHTPGGPVLFPISNLDRDVREIETGLVPEINARVIGSENDAEENTAGVQLDSSQLEMTSTSSVGAETMLASTIAASSDDADQGSGGLSTSRGHQDCCSRVNGLRFTGITIPAGAPVLSAYIEFVADRKNNEATTITFAGHKVTNSATFSGAADVNSRTGAAATTATVTWNNVPAWEASNRYRTPDLSAIVQEIVDIPGWASGNPVTFTFQGTGNRRARTLDFFGANVNAAQLFVTYGTAPGVPPGPQTIGLRFQDVRIPQGQGIRNAVIEFIPAKDATAAANLRVRGELNVDSPPFAAAPGSVTGRTWSTPVPWSAPASTWKEGVAARTSDLTAIVQAIVDQPGWCGGNAVSFAVDGPGATGPFSAISFDGDPGLSPVLRVDFDDSRPPGPGQGCVVKEITRRVSRAADDANQEIASPSPLSVAATAIRMDDTQANGLRFASLAIPPGAVIEDARLRLKVPAAGTLPLTINIQGHAVDTAASFVAATGADVITRTPLTAPVAWTPVDWDADSVQESPSIAPIINSIVNGALGWASGNDLALIMSSSGAGSLTAESFDSAPSEAPLLRVRIRLNIGDVPGAAVTTVRDRLKQIVNDLDHKGSTPIVDTLYEAAVNYRGESVTWGLDRGTSETAVKLSSRVSHPDSYVGGTVNRAAGCTDWNLSAPECESENITGSATYVSPITSECQANFIVLLTDGIANENDSQDLIQTMIKKASCESSLPGGEDISDDESCGIDLAKFLHDPANDQAPDLPGASHITLYTIGLEITDQWLKDLADAGGGKFYQAGTTDEIVRTFNDIVADILSNTTSFATPSLSVNSFNRLFHLEEVYFSLFQPLTRTAWPGNVKKYQVCSSTVDGCTVGEILDARPPPDGPLSAIGDDGRILENALSFWTAVPDGPRVLEGGASAHVPNFTTRRVFTYTSDVPPSFTSLVATGEHFLVDVNGDGILDGLIGGSADERLQRTKDLLGWPGPAVTTLTDEERAALVTTLNEHINWIRGQDVDDEDLDGNTTEDRYSFGDPLHSSAVAVTFGGTEDTPVVKVFVGTNDGAIRALNGFNGEEEFIFYPPSLLPQLVELRKNPDGQHRYGVDGTPTIWLNDVDGNGVIERGEGDFARLFIGMRRGGNEIFALDVTPTPTGGLEVSDINLTSSINPVYMWHIQGSSAAYPRLGQTWSRPLLATVTIGNFPSPGVATPSTVLLFAGGYSEVQDTGFGPGGLGNAIYMASALTGQRLLSVSPEDPGSGDRVVVPPELGMNFPIPSNLALLDTTGDRSVNRIYVGDTGGQLWRLDLAPKDIAVTTDPGVVAVLGKLGTVSSDGSPADQRKYFEPPDVVRVRAGAGVSTVPNYELVTIVSGNRAHPLDLTTQDRYFAFRDAVIGRMADVEAPFGIADDFVTLQGPLDSPPTVGDLFDVTPIAAVEGDDLTALQGANGYYLDLVEPGEKGLSSPIILEGKVFFTSYLPEAVVDIEVCSLAEGGGRLYGFNVLSGAAVFNWDGSPDSDPLSVADRSLALGSGIPSSAVPIFQPEKISLLIGGSSGASVVDPGLQLLRQRTFWFEQDQ